MLESLIATPQRMAPIKLKKATQSMSYSFGYLSSVKEEKGTKPVNSLKPKDTTKNIPRVKRIGVPVNKNRVAPSPTANPANIFH